MRQNIFLVAWVQIRSAEVGLRSDSVPDSRTCASPIIYRYGTVGIIYTMFVHVSFVHILMFLWGTYFHSYYLHRHIRVYVKVAVLYFNNNSAHIVIIFL